MRYMVIERFRFGPAPVYERAATRGRMLPAGLEYIESWVEADGLSRCYQLMETDDPSLFDQWVAAWSDIVDFEIVPILSSTQATARVRGGTKG